MIALKLKIKAPVAIRVNPNIDPGSHEYIATGLNDTKFGINLNNMMEAFSFAHKADFINLIGIDYVGIGSDYDGLDCLPNGWMDCLDHIKIAGSDVVSELRGFHNFVSSLLPGSDDAKSFDRLAVDQAWPPADQVQKRLYFYDAENDLILKK